MKERTRKIFIMIVMAALIVSLMAASFAALTYGRYSGGRRDENSAYEDILDLVGETAFEVSTADELVNAINNGYSYIKVVGDDPTLVVNNDVADVLVNLVLDVNGHKIVRNSRNPLLNVRQSVSVVLVYDSSEKAEGGFYNPVGSALQTSGGTLTVGEGVYESGPRTGIGLDFSDTVSATVCSRDGRKAASYSAPKTDQTFPKLTEDTGDVYLDKTYSGTGEYLKPDTYLIYTEEENAFVGDGNGSGEFEDGQLYVNRKETSSGETTTITADKFSPICDVASCDFYYYYPVGTAGTANSPQTYAVVYGYNDVKTLAEDCTDKTDDHNHTDLSKNGLVWPYAAIRSEAGNTHARGGAFSTYFGTQNTYSIYSEGGTMTVGSAGSSSAAGPAFEAVGEGVCISMSAKDEDTLTISSGSFSSEIGNTIEMSGGEMEVKKGTFTKTDCKKGTGDKQLENQTAIISLTGGTLNVSGTKTGDDTYSVTMTARGTENGGTLENVFGIRADDGGEISTTGVSFHIYGDYSAGVLSYDGKIDLGSGTVINVTQSDEKKDANNNTLLTSAGVSSEQASEGEEHPVNLSGGVTITSNGLGITARGVVNVTGGESTVETTCGTGIYVNNGQFKVDKGAIINVNSTVQSGFSWTTPPESQTTNAPNIYNGVYVQGGSLVSNGTLNVTFTGVENESHDSYDALKIRSYAVRVEAAATGGNSEVSIAGGTISNSVGGGVSVNGGTVTLGKKGENNGENIGLTVQATGTDYGSDKKNGPDDNPKSNWVYYENKTGGHAVEVDAGELLVYNGLYTAKLGNGILVRNGNAWVLGGTFQGNDTKNYRDNYGGNLPAGPAAYYALKLLGGSVTTFGGTFGTYTVDDNTTHTAGGSSAFVTGVSSQATANIFGGSFVVNGQSGFSVYENVDLTFTPKKKITVGEDNDLEGSDVKVSAATTAIAIENTTNTNVSVTINGGTFESTRDDSGQRDGIWDSNPYAKLTINQPDGQTTISAQAKHGINLVYAPAIENGVTITGGTIEGKQDGIYYGSNGTAANGLLISGGTIEGKSGSGLNLAGAPAASGAVTISGGTITGYQDGILYSKSTAIDGNGYGLTIKGGTITGTGTTDVHAHALNINTEPRQHSILIEDGATLNGGRDAIYVSESGGDDEAVSITGGSIQGGTVSSGGCALWFANNIDNGVFVISGGKFESKGGNAIGTNNPNVYRLLRILPDGYLLTDRGGKTYDRDKYFRDIDGISEITVSMS